MLFTATLKVNFLMMTYDTNFTSLALFFNRKNKVLYFLLYEPDIELQTRKSTIPYPFAFWYNCTLGIRPKVT